MGPAQEPSLEPGLELSLEPDLGLRLGASLGVSLDLGQLYVTSQILGVVECSMSMSVMASHQSSKFSPCL